MARRFGSPFGGWKRKYNVPFSFQSTTLIDALSAAGVAALSCGLLISPIRSVRDDSPHPSKKRTFSLHKLRWAIIDQPVAFGNGHGAQSVDLRAMKKPLRS